MVIVTSIPETTVTGPLMSDSLCFVKFRIKHFMSVVFPTFGGPTIAIIRGGGSTAERSTIGI